MSSNKYFLMGLKKDINKLERELKSVEFVNAKIRFFRNLKIGLCFSRLLAPYIITAGCTFGIFNFFGVTPFVKDVNKQKYEVRKEIDSLGDINVYSQYGHFDDQTSSIVEYSKWKKNGDFYYREVKTYDLKNYNEETVMEMLDNPSNYSLEDLFGRPSSDIMEKKNNVSSEELEKPGYVKASLCSIDNENYILIEETSSTNSVSTLGWILLTLFVEVAPLSYRIDHSNFDFGRSVRRIKATHEEVDPVELVRKIKVKKATYDRLANGDE